MGWKNHPSLQEAVDEAFQAARQTTNMLWVVLVCHCIICRLFLCGKIRYRCFNQKIPSGTFGHLQEAVDELFQHIHMQICMWNIIYEEFPVCQTSKYWSQRSPFLTILNLHQRLQEAVDEAFHEGRETMNMLCIVTLCHFITCRLFLCSEIIYSCPNQDVYKVFYCMEMIYRL